MLGLFDDPTPLRVIGIDPGTDTLGVSVLDVCLATNRISLVSSQTFSGLQMSRNYRWVSDVHGDKIARLKAHEENLYYIFCDMQPHEVICESPFLGRLPAAFRALIECLDAIRSALMRYDDRIPLLTVDPPTVKNALGVNGKSGDKSLMRHGVLRLTTLENPNNVALEQLDEHSIDSIAVAYVRANHVISNNHYPQLGDRRRVD